MSDTSVYPDAIDGYSQIPLVVDGVTQVNAASVNKLRSAIINIENELGVRPSGDFNDVSSRLEDLEQQVAAITGGEDLIGDTVQINFVPDNYIRDNSIPEADFLNQLSSHLKGIDNEIENINNSISSSVDIPASVTTNALARWSNGTPNFKDSSVILDDVGNLSGIESLEVNSQKFWGARASNPLTSSPGDMYYNTVIGMMMYYDSLRSKWLSIESAIFEFGRNGNTAAGQYYRWIDGKVFTDSIGFYALRNGTVVSITYTKSDANNSTIEVTSNGSQITTLLSNSTAGRDLNADADFNFGDILGVRNLQSGDTTTDVQGWVRVKWKV